MGSVDVFGQRRIGHAVGAEPVAFVGDLISTAGRPNVQRSYASNWEQVVDSVKRLHALNPAIIYPGHGSKPLTTEELEALVEQGQRLSVRKAKAAALLTERGYTITLDALSSAHE